MENGVKKRGQPNGRLGDVWVAFVGVFTALH